jgi:hypothetical protein
MRFDTFFAARPLCSSSRASYLTGLCPRSHRIINNGKLGLDFIGHTLVTWPRLFANRVTRRPLSASGAWVRTTHAAQGLRNRARAEFHSSTLLPEHWFVQTGHTIADAALRPERRLPSKFFRDFLKHPAIQRVGHLCRLE